MFPRSRAYILAGISLVYLLAFRPLYGVFGPGTTVFSLVPVSLAAWFYGFPGALAGAAAAFGVNGFMLHGIRPGDLLFLLRQGGAAVAVAVTWSALVVAWVSSRRQSAHARLSAQRRIEQAAREADALYRTIFENTGTGIVILEADMTVALVNSEFEQISGYSREELEGSRRWDEFVHPEDLEKMRAYHVARRADTQAAPGSYEFRSIRKDGQVRSFLAVVALIPGTRRSVASLIDITGRQRIERIQRAVYEISAAAHASESLDLLYASIHDILAQLMPAENFFLALYDNQENQLSFPYFIDRYDLPPEPRRPGRGLTEYVLRTGQPLLVDESQFQEMVDRGEVELIGAPSSEWLGVPLVVFGETIGVMALQNYEPGVRLGEPEMEVLKFVSDQIAMVIQRKRAEEHLRYLSIHDPLTGLFNRMYFEEALETMERSGRFPVSILVADVDHLKPINDRLGHAAGDRHLVSAAQVIRAAFRSQDVVARIGGDEFAVLLPAADARMAEAAAGRLRRRIRDYNRRNGKEPALGISLGWAMAQAGEPLADALRLADQQMYFDKGQKEG